MNKKRFPVFLAFIGLFAGIAFAEVTLPKILTSNMVLQRDSPVPVWGHAAVGEKVKVSFAGQTRYATADTSGHWSVTLAPLTLNAKPAEMEISGSNTIVLSNILVGDVWLCSGQSNMEYPLDRNLKKYTAPGKGQDIAQEELSKPKSNQIRYIYAEKQREKGDIKSVGWITSVNDSVLRNISATGYFFGKEIYENTRVPIGIISTSWGGTRIEEWTPAWAYEKSPVFQSLTREKDFKIDNMSPGLKFESMLQPIIPFAIKGMIWYQGESNCIIEDQKTYTDKLKLMLETYRTLFNNPAMPFYYVQIAPYNYSKRTKDKLQHSPELLPGFWETQTNCLSLPYTGMAVTTDLVDNLSNIHPSYKWMVGHRLALWALAKNYDRKVCYSGPKYKSVSVKGRKIEISFEYADRGLVSKDGQPLSWFTIAGSDGNFIPAKAEIKGKKVIVWADEIKKPVSVRFAWNEAAMPNLFNKEGLPAIPFRTNK